MKYAAIYEKTATGYSAYLPDLPGCIATGHTLELTQERLEKAVQMHIGSMRSDGDPIPAPSTEVDYVEVPGHIVERRDSMLKLTDKRVPVPENRK